MAFKVMVVCVSALLVQSTFGYCIRNAEVTTASESCDCSCSSASSSSTSSRTRSSSGSGTVRAIGLGCFKGGKFVSGSGSSNVETTSCNNVINTDISESCESSTSSGSKAGSGSVRAIGLGCFKDGKFISGSGSSNIEVASCNNVINADVSESCECSTSNSESKTSTSSGSGSVRAIGLGCFKGGKFVSGSGSSNIESSSSNNVINTGCSVVNAGRIVTNAGSAGSLVSSSGPFIITCNGPVAPSGISVSAYSDLVGDLVVSGQLPFLSAVAFDGTFPTNGQAAVAYGCGDGNIAIREVIGDNSCACIRI